MDEEVITSQHWGVLLRAIVTDAALCKFRHEGRKVDVRFGVLQCPLRAEKTGVPQLELSVSGTWRNV